jgi:hypothetical protein
MPSRTEPALAPLCFRQGFDDFPVHMGDALKDHLGDSVAIIYRKGFCSEVDEDDLDLTPVIGIDGTGCIQDRNAVFYRYTAPGC